MTTRLLALAGFAILLACPATVSAQSFDCRKASTAIEKMICADPEISRLDSQMAERYRTLLSTALKTGSDHRSGATAAQQRWLAEVRNAATRPADLRSRYQERIDHLAMAIRCLTTTDLEWAEITACERIGFEDSDAELQVLYRRLLAQPDMRADPEATRMLTESQRTWVTFRDAECEWQTIDSRGGTIRPMQIYGCSHTLTRQRIQQLTPLP